MEKNPLISIVLPVFNGEKYIRQSIESCLYQTYSNIELIVVNDCSTDSTLQIIEKYAELDSRVRVVNNNENKKLPACLNIGHREAKGSFITWTSDDNIYVLNAISQLYSGLIKSRADIVYSNFYLIDELDNVTGELIKKTKEFLPFENIVGACFLYSREVYNIVGGYDENLIYVEDYAFWLEAYTKNFHFYKLDKNLYYYRLHNESLTSETKGDKKSIWEENLRTVYYRYTTKISCKKSSLCEILIALHVNQTNILEKLLDNLFFFKNDTTKTLDGFFLKLLVDKVKGHLNSTRIIRVLFLKPKRIFYFLFFIIKYR